MEPCRPGTTCFQWSTSCLFRDVDIVGSAGYEKWGGGEYEYLDGTQDRFQSVLMVEQRPRNHGCIDSCSERFGRMGQMDTKLPSEPAVSFDLWGSFVRIGYELLSASSVTLQSQKHREFLAIVSGTETSGILGVK